MCSNKLYIRNLYEKLYFFCQKMFVFDKITSAGQNIPNNSLSSGNKLIITFVMYFVNYNIKIFFVKQKYFWHK